MPPLVTKYYLGWAQNWAQRLEAWGRHLDALDRVGGVAYLEQVALTHPQVFVALLGRVLPLTVKGESAEPVTIQIVKPW